MAQNVGWRWIFFIAAALSLVGMLMVRGTPESRTTASGPYKFDFAGIATFMVMMVALQTLATQGGELGWTSPASLGLLAASVVSGVAFVMVERRSADAFVDFGIFRNLTFTGATISNFMLNGTAGLLIVAMSLVQLGGDMSAQEAGFLTLGYAISIVAFIRAGEKLLQRYGARKPMIWGSLIVGVAVVLLMPTHLTLGTYKLLAVVAFSLFGVGLAFYATPSTDAALSSLSDAQTGSGAGVYKMASSLGASFGVAISAAVFTALSRDAGPVHWIEGVISYVGRQDNVDVRQAAFFALGVSLFMVIAAIVSIMLTIPKGTKAEQGATQ